MILDDIKNYAKQFEYEPKVENAAKLGKRKFTKFIVAGMGGSHLAADIIKAWHPEMDIIIWPNYGLPPFREKELKEHLVIVSSYSGNTEETIDAFNAAKEKHCVTAIIAARGKLISLAQKFKVPYVQMPDFHMQPRMATGLSLLAMLAVMGEKAWLAEARELGRHPAHRARGAPRARPCEAAERSGARDLRLGAQRRDRLKLENKVQRNGKDPGIL